MPFDIDRAIRDANSDEIRVCLQQSKELLSKALLKPGSKLRVALENEEFHKLKPMLDSLKTGVNIQALTGNTDEYVKNMLTIFPVFGPRKTPVVNKVRRWGIMTTLLCVIGALVLAVFFSKLSVKMAGAVSKSWAGIVDTHAEYVQNFSLVSSWNSLWTPPLCAIEMEIKTQMAVLAADFRASKNSLNETFGQVISEYEKRFAAEKHRFSSEAQSVLDAFKNVSSTELTEIRKSHEAEVEKMRQEFSQEMEEVKAELGTILEQMKEQLNNSVEAFTLIKKAGEIQLTKQSQAVLDAALQMNITKASAQELGKTVVDMKAALDVETAKLETIRQEQVKTATELAEQKKSLNAHIFDTNKRVKRLYRYVQHLITPDGGLTWVGCIAGILFYSTYFYLVFHVCHLFFNANACMNIGVVGLIIAFFVCAYCVYVFVQFVYGNVVESVKIAGDTVNNIPHVFEHTMERAVNTTFARVFGA